MATVSLFSFKLLHPGEYLLPVHVPTYLPISIGMLDLATQRGLTARNLIGH